MDESSNKSVKNASGKPIKIPDFSADESQNYDFLRDITLARNGLWSDVPEVVNLTGLRLEHGSTKIQWDDNISASWLDAQGRKHVKIYTATTEPGDRTAYKTMLPQTMIFVPGYHQGKMPAMRGHRTVTFDPTAKFPARLIFNTNDERGLNLHPGGTTGAIKQLKRYILPTDAKTKSEFDAVLVFMEIFEILSHWGLDPKLPAWNVLSNWANKNALSPGLLSDGKIAVFQDQSSASIKQINVAAARAWTAKKWQNNRASLVKILRSVDASFIAPVKLNKLDLKGLEALITDAHVAGIVQKQCDYFIEPKEVDGLAGDRFLAMLEAGISQEGALANLANNDFLRLAALFSKFNGQSQVLTTARLNYVKQLITQTLIERAKLQESKAEVLRTVSGQAVQENVGTWSILCQVVFGPEMFYEMMRYSLANAQKTGQRYWYYTLIDLASVPKK
jgi:RNase P/RNase MRP subunit POP5